MTRRRLLACFGMTLALAALLLMPLSLAIRALGLDASGLAAIEAAGTVWHGTLRKASWRGQPLGDLSLALQPGPLLTGVRRIRLSGDGFSAAVLTGRIDGVADARGELMLQDIGVPGATARISLHQATMRFADDRCLSAEGTVRVLLVLPALRAGIQLAGPLACVGDLGRLVLATDPTAGAAPVTVETIVEVSHDGRYRLQSLARSDDPGVRLALQLAGFQHGPAGQSRVDSGRLGD
jgi:general secretion pathway protein N